MRETRLKLVIADLLISGCALRASATATYERRRNAISDFPLCHVLADRRDNASQFMTGYVGRSNVCIVSDPAMPVAAADTRSHDFDDYSVCFESWISNILQFWYDTEGFINYSFHQAGSLFEVPGHYAHTPNEEKGRP